MGRLHNPHKGIGTLLASLLILEKSSSKFFQFLAGSALPYKRSAPRWLKITSDEVSDQIFKLARKGLTPSAIGVILRDSFGVAQVKAVTGNKILRILKKNGLVSILFFVI